MRIRNSRPPFPLSYLQVRCVSRCNDFRSRKGPDFDERFLVEDASRRIGWSSYLLTRPLREDADEAEMQGKLRIVIAGDTEPLNHVKQTNEMANCEPEPMQTQEGTRNEGRDPNLSSIWERDAKKFKFSDSVVLALEAPIRSDKELPLKKRKICGQWKITMNDARKGKGVTVAEIKTKAMSMTETEFSSTLDCNMVTKNINCVLNSESSIPSPPTDTTAVSTTMKTAIETEIKPKRKRGRPRRTVVMNNECEC